MKCFSLFRCYWEHIGEDICDGLQEMFDNGYISNEITNGLIFLVPKSDGSSEDIRKWRPIAMVNTIYRIFAKVLARILQPFLSDLWHSSQTGFIKERIIFDNTFTFWKAIALAKTKGDDLAFY